MANNEATVDAAPSAPVRSGGGGGGGGAPGGAGGRAAPTTRRIGRNKSSGAPRGLTGGTRGAGPPSSRMAPKRSQSHRIGRPTFTGGDKAGGAAAGVGSGVAGMAATQQKTRTRAAPVATGSFRRAVPNRSSSSNSLRQFRRNQQGSNTPFARQANHPGEGAGYDGDTTDCDSVFTSASTQTMDSIMLRKKQNGGGLTHTANGGAAARGVGSGVGDGGYVDFDESIHTVDSIKVHMKHVIHQQPLEGGGDDDEGDMSVFSESSFDDTDTYLLSDYEEVDELDGAEGVDHDGGIPEEVGGPSDDEGGAGIPEEVGGVATTATQNDADAEEELKEEESKEEIQAVE